MDGGHLQLVGKFGQGLHLWLQGIHHPGRNKGDEEAPKPGVGDAVRQAAVQVTFV